MTLLAAIDPGPHESALVLYDTRARRVVAASDLPNEALLVSLHGHGTSTREAEALALEDFVPYGQRLSWESLRTVKWIGRFDAAWTLAGRGALTLVSRPTVRTALCGPAAKLGDADVRQALYQRFGGGCRSEAVGRKAAPGPLYGVRGHQWAALALAVAVAEGAAGACQTPEERTDDG